MTKESLKELVTARAECSMDGDALCLEGTSSLTLYASVGHETLTIAAVAKLEWQDELVIASTKKGDIYAVAAQDLRGLRISADRERSRTGLI